MVALLRHHHGADSLSSGGRPGQLRLVVDNSGCPEDFSGGREATDRRSDRLDHSVGRAKSPAADLRGQVASFDGMTVGLLVAAALVVFGGLLWVRAAQGGATAESWDGVEQVAAERSAASAASGAVAGVSADGTLHTVVAGPGDSLWSIALEIAPDSDPRPVVAALIEANGGESVQIGQQIVVPEQLLD